MWSYHHGIDIGGGGDTRNILAVVLIILLIAPIATAGSGLGIADALADAVKKGLDKFMITIADRMYETSYRPAGTFNVSANASSTEVMIYATTTHTVDPWANTEIQEFRMKTLLMLIVYAAIYGAIGLIYVLLMIVLPHATIAIDEMLNRGSDFRSARIKQYFMNLIAAIGVITFTDLVLKMLFILNYVFVSFLIVSCMSMHSLTPSADNVILYLFMGTSYAILTWFMCCRDLLLYVFVAISYLIGALLISNKTRDMGISIAYYYTGILFMQSMIVLLTTVGYIGAKAICASTGIAVGVVSELVIYFVLLFILLWTAIKYLFGLKRYKKTVTTAVKLVV